MFREDFYPRVIKTKIIFIKLHEDNNNLVTIMKVQCEIIVRPKRWRIGDHSYATTSSLNRLLSTWYNLSLSTVKTTHVFLAREVSRRKSFDPLHTRNEGREKKKSDNLFKNLACSYVSRKEGRKSDRERERERQRDERNLSARNPVRASRRKNDASYEDTSS